MKKLKILLRSNYFYYIFLFFIILHIIFWTKIINYQSYFNDGEIKIEGEIIKYSIYQDKISLVLNAGEKINVTYYIKENNKIYDLKIGNKVFVKGNISSPSKNTIPNTFNYQKYLYINGIYKTLKANEVKIINDNINIFEKIKDWVYKRTEKNEYLKLFIIGDKSSLNSNVYENFKDSGVAHLLAVSGMHVSVLVMIMSYLFRRLKVTHQKLLISSFLLFYAYLVNFTPSILRVVVFYILNSLNVRFDFNLNYEKILFFTAVLLLLFKPFFIYQVGFIYSFVTAFSLFLTRKYLKNNYWMDILIVSFWALMFTLPITVSLNYEINLLTFISNLLLIPFVTFVLYPFSLICFVFPFLLPLFAILTKILEIIMAYIGSINLFMFNIPKLNFIIISLYYLLLFLLVKYNLRRYIFLVVLLIAFVKISVFLDGSYYVNFFDIGQGDSSLLISPRKKKVIMIDTGGIVSFDQDKSYYVSDNVILYLKSLGISKISYLILSHGDYDHMGEAINLVDKFKVEK